MDPLLAWARPRCKPSSSDMYRKRAVNLHVAEQLVHRTGRLGAARLADDTRRNAGNGLVRRNGGEDDRTRGDLAAMTDLDIAENFCACTNENAAPNFRVTVFRLLAGSAKRHAVEDRYVILDDGGLPDHEAGRMIDEDALADCCG